MLLLLFLSLLFGLLLLSSLLLVTDGLELTITTAALARAADGLARVPTLGHPCHVALRHRDAEAGKLPALFMASPALDNFALVGLAADGLELGVTAVAFANAEAGLVLAVAHAADVFVPAAQNAPACKICFCCCLVVCGCLRFLGCRLLSLAGWLVAGWLGL